MTTRINKDLVTHIEIHDLEYVGYYYLPEIKIKTWCGTKIGQEEGVYRKYGDLWIEKECSVEVFEKDYNFIRIEDKYYEPIHIKIFAGEKRLKLKRFKTLTEANEYCDKEFPNVLIV
jgi:hypothetical protein